MEPRKRDFVDRLYLVFLLWHCEAFFVASDRAYAEHLEARRASEIGRRPSFFATQRAFTDFESALAFAANISKMLNPTFFRPNEKLAALKRARRIRSLVGIRKRDSALTTLRRANKVRNNFEHVDLRLDKWAAQTQATGALMHALARDLRYIEETDRFNRYNPRTRQLIMMGDKVHMARLWDAVRLVWVSAMKANREIEERWGLPGLS